MAHLRALGGGGLQVGKYGFGGAPIAGLFEAVDEDQARACLAQAWHDGMRYFDTAPHYGAGTSERRIGSFLAAKPRDEWVLSTKVGRLLRSAGEHPSDAHSSAGFAGDTSTRVFDFSRDGIRRSHDESLARLGLDRVDILFLHDPDDHWQQAIDEALPTLASMRDEGLVRSIGAGMNQSAMLTRFVQETDVDVVLLAGRYTLLDQRALDDLLPACLERGTSVVLGGVFNSGVLANPDRNVTYDYGQAPPDVIERAARIADLCARHGVDVRAAALQFPLAHRAITTVVIGARSREEVEQNTQYARAVIPSQLWDDLRSEGLLRADVPVPTDHPAPETDTDTDTDTDRPSDTDRSVSAPS